MFDVDRWREIFESIRNNKLRTILGAFTVTLGIFIFTVLFGMGNGLKNTFQAFFIDDAQNSIFIRSGLTTKPYKGFKENRRIRYENEDYDIIKETFREKIEYISARYFSTMLAKNKQESGSYSIQGVHPDHQFIENTIVNEGRFVNDFDIKNKNRNIVIGRLVEQDLFKNENALGKFLSLNGIMYKIVGVFSDAGGDNVERLIYMPISTIQSVYKGTEKINQISLTYNLDIGVENAKILVNDIEALLKERHFVAQRDMGGVRIRSTFEEVAKNLAFASTLQMIVLFIGIGTLFAGAIAIGNIMVFVVKERTKELGIRKALGAQPANIVGMILQESIFITAIAGYIGIVLAVLTLNTLGNKLEEYFITNPEVSLATIIWATIILILVGGVAGFLPALRAAKIKPIIALSDN